MGIVSKKVFFLKEKAKIRVHFGLVNEQIYYLI